MNDLLKHRGPDDEGYLLANSTSKEQECFSGTDSVDLIKQKHKSIREANFEKYNVIIGHRRLSIIDLSINGHGPMCDKNGICWITYNGEIYNYIELREELKSLGFEFRTNSDTEVILYSYLQWGKDCLTHFNGMWGFGIWDSRDNSLFLAKDRFGIKPLYYTLSSNYFAFSSEIKPLLYIAPEEFEVNESKIPFFILYGNRLNTEETYTERVFSVKPSHYILYKNGSISSHRYYDVKKNTENVHDKKYLKEQLVTLLTDSIKLRFRSDVPVGTCLSGGFDSSTIVSLSSGMYSGKLNTFSAVWNEKECDESKYIDIVNKKFNCIENKIIPKPEDFENILDKLTYFQEIPTEGPGLYPQWYVMKKAKEKIKVLLDGQGGDEVFGGYYSIETYLRSIVADKEIKEILRELKNFISFLNKQGIHSFSNWLFPRFYNKIIRIYFTKQHRILKEHLIKGIKKRNIYFDSRLTKKFDNNINNLSYHYLYNLTIPTLLHYEDRASMAHSIESRVPFLDYRLVEFGINLNPKYLINKSISRPLFRESIANFIPDEIVKRTDKLGYPTPFTKWSRTLLKSLILDTLLSPNSKITEYINIDYLKKRLNKHFSDQIDFSWNIWRLLALEKFLLLYKNKEYLNFKNI